MDDHAARAELVSLMQRDNCGKAPAIAHEARGMHGVRDQYGLISAVMNLEAVNTYGGTYDIHALIPGRGQTGRKAFS